MYFISFLCLYLLIGMIFGFNHVSTIKKLVIEAGDKEKALREMVAMYEYSPQGAEYYAQLQELYVVKAELLAEYKLLKANEFSYELQLFLMGAILWPYYMIFISQTKKYEKREWRR
ncbi:hypothetical protein ABFV99_13535 [Cytobacillus horneckiae]|uniref:hypothetical protein n=1 Tax=Cytobacillus horneckiae TaxID=549687 RepID=UPI0034CEA8BD